MERQSSDPAPAAGALELEPDGDAELPVRPKALTDGLRVVQQQAEELCNVKLGQDPGQLAGANETQW